MRILQLITRRQLRGAEVFAAELADALDGRGHACSVLALYAPGRPPLQTIRAPILDLGGTQARGVDVGTVRRLMAFHRNFRPDLVQANGSDTLKYAVLARALGGGRWPLVYRNISIASRWLRGPVHRSVNRLLLSRVDHIVAVSQASASDMTRTYGVEGTRLSVIPQTVQIQPVSPGDARVRLEVLTGASLTGPLLMHIGSFTPEKNHEGVLRIFQRVRHARPDADLVLIGDGPLFATIRARVHDERMEGVHLLRARNDAGELVAAADLLLLPSFIEGLPGVVLEAAAQRVPSVATRVGGVGEAIRHGETGVLVAPDQEEAFSQAVLDLLHRPEELRRLGAAAHEWVSESFAFEGGVERYEVLYHRLGAGGR